MARRRFLHRSAWRGISLGFVCALVCWGLTYSSFVRGLDNLVQDSYFFLRGDRPTQAKVVIIGLDEYSLEKDLAKPLIYASPELAEVIRYAKRCGTRAVGIDIILPQQAATWPDVEQVGGVGEARTLGQAIFETGNVVLAQWDVGGELRLPPPQWLFKSLIFPQPTDLAFVNQTPDGDQFVRRQQLLISGDGPEPTPQFAMAILALARGVEFKWNAESEQLELGDEVVPLDSEQKLRINFVGGPGSFPVLPFHQILAASRANEPGFSLLGGTTAVPMLRRGFIQPQPLQLTLALQDAMVVLGVTAGDWQDYHPVPYSNFFAGSEEGNRRAEMSGPEIHAHIIATIEDKAYLYSSAWYQPALLLIIGPLLGMAAMRFNMMWMLLITVGYSVGCYFLGALAFTEFGLQIKVVAFFLLGGLICLLAFVRRGIHLQRTLRAVKSAPIAKAFEADPGRLTLGGEHREVTVLFADVRSFTSFSERFRDDPQRVVALLNAYFTAIVPLIEDEGGTLNQYMGDGIMVIFGAPEDQDDHALRAVRAALAMAQCVRDRTAEWEKLGFPNMKIGVGINTGDVVVGAIGSPRRLDYSAIGDTTNTAARIEAKNKEFGTEILISEDTLRVLPVAECQRLGLDKVEPLEVTVKGKEDVLRLFPVLLAAEATKTAST